MTYPDRKNTIALLGDWQKHHTAVQKLMDGIETSMGLDPGGPLFDTVWKLFDAYTETLAHQVGDHGKWLEWFFSENEMGGSALEAGYDGQLITIGSLEDLYRLIELSRERNQP